MTRLTLFEHERVLLQPDGPLTPVHLEGLQRFHAASPQRYFELCYRGIVLTSYVGVLRIGQLQLEILPKTDRNRPAPFWRDRLLEMLRVVHGLPLAAPTSSHLRTRPTNLLDLYLELYAREVTTLLQRGLARRYRTEEQNETALRGKLVFHEQLRHNLVHRERFHTARSVYDHALVHNQLVRQGLIVADALASDDLTTRNLRVLIDRFPQLPAVVVSEATFDRLPLTRKTRPYAAALTIARMLLLHYHPDVAGGRDRVLALLFDMNGLWERFLTVALRKYLTGYEVRAQSSRTYWQTTRGSAQLRPDIVLRTATETVVLDAKWKLLPGRQPGAQDLRQLYAYGTQFGARRTALLVPGAGAQVRGEFTGGTADSGVREGSVLYVPVGGAGEEWLRQIAGRVGDWLDAAAQ